MDHLEYQYLEAIVTNQKTIIEQNNKILSLLQNSEIEIKEGGKKDAKRNTKLV